jgi:small-conductance mechanosensitive channel
LTSHIAYTNNQFGLWRNIPDNVDSEANVREVQNLLVGVAESYSGTEDDLPPTAVLVDFDNAALHLILNAWILDIKDKARSEAELRILILEALQEKGIKLAA